MVSNSTQRRDDGRHKGGRFRAVLMSFILVSALWYLRSAVIHGTSLRSAYEDALPAGWDVDAPELSIQRVGSDTIKSPKEEDTDDVSAAKKPLNTSLSTTPDPKERSPPTNKTSVSNHFDGDEIMQNRTGNTTESKHPLSELPGNQTRMSAEIENRTTSIFNFENQTARVFQSNATSKDNLTKDETEILEDASQDAEDVETDAEENQTEEEDDDDDDDDNESAEKGTPLQETSNEVGNLPKALLESTSPTQERYNASAITFQRQEGVVIATKVHGPHHLPLLEQSLCLLHHAYNKRHAYDILVFTTTVFPREQLVSLRKMVAPANVTVVVDNRGLKKEIAALSPVRYQNFLKACNVSSPANLTWWSNCPGRIAYNWQAQFRSTFWRHPALAPYKYMMWLDTDAFSTKEWPIDPIQIFVEQDLVIMFDNWPKGRHKGADIHKRMFEAFNVTLCKLKVSNGHFITKIGYKQDSCYRKRIGDIHGFFHITNLDFYRSDIVQRWAEAWIGDGFLQRRYDDQFAVTAPAAILAPNRSWDMRKSGIKLDVYHNFDLDGKKKDRVGGFRKYWKKTGRHQMPEAFKLCPVKAAN